MKAITTSLAVAAVMMWAANSQAVTLQQCHEAAAGNYPEIKRYQLVELATDYDIANAKKAYLPQVQAYGQATWQNAVSSFPDKVERLYEQMGVELKGMSKDQYRVGIDASQVIWDGGATRSRIEQLQAEGQVNHAKSNLTIYQVRSKVNELYFGILMLEENLKQTEVKMHTLESNLKLINSYVKGGVATVSDAQRVEAEMASTRQQRSTIEETDKAYRKVLGIFTGLDLTSAPLERPADLAVDDKVESNHPQLAYLDAQRAALEAQRHSIKASLMPQVSAIGTAYYGRPGYDMFKAMFQDKFSFNFMVGMKATWSLSSLYSKKNNEAKIDNAERELNVERDKFLFNTSMTTAAKQGSIAAGEKELSEDDTIIALRQSVRKATESKLKHGIIVPDDLVKDVSSEHMARLARAYRELEILKNKYDIKYTVGGIN